MFDAALRRPEFFVAATMPRITGGAIQHVDGSSGCDKEESSCGSGPWTYLQFAIAEHANDDHAVAERVTYAVYLERSAAEARAATTPFRLLRTPMLLSDGSLSQNISLDHGWADADAFISVSALDVAGNESPRSEPYQVNAAASGCAVSLHHRRSSVSVTALLALAGLTRARRRARARAIAVSQLPARLRCADWPAYALRGLTCSTGTERRSGCAQSAAR
jgi:hypothetical protein